MTRRICIPLVVLALLLGCGYSVPPEPTRRAQSDQLDEVIGQVELVASVERGEGGGGSRLGAPGFSLASRVSHTFWTWRQGEKRKWTQM